MSKVTKIYWRASGVPTWGLIFLIVVSVLALLAAENLRQRDPIVNDNYATMITASRTMRDAMEHLKPLRAELEAINPDFDPQRSGLIGIDLSPVTTTRGGRESKQTTINPNWAAVAVKLLAQAGVEKGDLVAVTISGSFPALNLAVYSAIHAMEAEPVIIASASSSQWGANVPDFLWIDMERELRQANIVPFRPVAASVGGVEDRGADLSANGIAIIKEAIQESDIRLLEPANYEEAVADRIAIFREFSADRPYKAFINVGGGATIVGPPGIDDQFGSGLMTAAPARAYAVETVMGYFLRNGIPAIQMIGIKDMAERYGLPIAPIATVPVGDGDVYSSTVYQRWLAVALFLALFGLTWLIVRSARITSVWRSNGHSGKGVKPMV